VGIVVGIVMTAFAATYRMKIVGPWFRRPTPADQTLQAFFYLVINAPVEELFFRGFLLAVVTQWTGWLGWGWLASTALYTLYHRLGKWNWRSVGGVSPTRCSASSSSTVSPPGASSASVMRSCTNSGNASRLRCY
jgi:membrane protease YdiL (CAAX protease family)